MSEFLRTSGLTETQGFVKKTDVRPGKAAIIYSMPTPDDSPVGKADAAEVTLTGEL